MSALQIDAIVTRALVENKFGRTILNGKRSVQLETFDLTEQERAAVLAIEADDLDQFIRRVAAWMQANDWESALSRAATPEGS